MSRGRRILAGGQPALLVLLVAFLAVPVTASLLYETSPVLETNESGDGGDWMDINEVAYLDGVYATTTDDFAVMGIGLGAAGVAGTPTYEEVSLRILGYQDLAADDVLYVQVWVGGDLVDDEFLALSASPEEHVLDLTALRAWSPADFDSVSVFLVSSVTGTVDGAWAVDFVSLLVIANRPPQIPVGVSGYLGEGESMGFSLPGSDPDSDPITFAIVTPPAHGTLSGFNAATGDVIYTAAADYAGTDSFVYSVTDGESTPVQATVGLLIEETNDAPTFVAGAAQTVNEDSGTLTVPNWATAISPGPPEESSQTVAFLVTQTAGPALAPAQLPTVSPAGTLAFTPPANLFGTLQFQVVAQDNGGTLNGGVDTSSPQTLTITVTGINDAPSFTKGADQTVLEDAGGHIILGWATAISPGPNEVQAVEFFVMPTNPGLFAVQPTVSPAGTLAFTPASHAHGTTTVEVSVGDGIQRSVPQTFTISISPVNDAPAFASGPAITVAEDSGSFTRVGWATGIAPGPANEAAQSVSFTVTNSNPGLFSVQPALSAAGTLTFVTAPDKFGTADMTVVAKDTGGTANGGIDTSAPRIVAVTITPLNDAPILDPIPLQVVLAGSSVSFVVAGQDVDGDALNFTAGGGAKGDVTMPGARLVTYTPDAGFIGRDTVWVRVTDGHGGSDNRTVAIYVGATPGFAIPDVDQDGFDDATDNCPLLANADQADVDRDGAGNACDTDRDGDGVADAQDRFPNDRTESADLDSDGIGDNADTDDDGDRLPDGEEAGIGTDPRRADTDGDGLDDGRERDAGSDPTSAASPSALPRGVRSTVDGADLTITWEPATDPRVTQYTVWRDGTSRPLATLPGTATEFELPGGAVEGGTFWIQGERGGSSGSLDLTRAARVQVTGTGPVVGPDDASRDDGTNVSGSAKAAVPTWFWLAGGGGILAIVLLMLVVVLVVRARRNRPAAAPPAGDEGEWAPADEASPDAPPQEPTDTPVEGAEEPTPQPAAA